MITKLFWCLVAIRVAASVESGSVGVSALQWAAAEAEPDAEADFPEAPVPAPVENLDR